MISLICIFFPAVLSVWFFESVTKQNLNLKLWIYRFCMNSVIINGVVFAVKWLVTGTSAELLASPAADMTPDVAIRYLIMALSIAAVLVIVESLLTKKITVCITEENDEQKNGQE